MADEHPVVERFPRAWENMRVKNRLTGECLLEEWIREKRINAEPDWLCARGLWMIYQNGIWREDGNGAKVNCDIARFICEVTEYFDLAGKKRAELEKASFIEAVMRRASYELFVEPDIFDPIDHWIAFPCGVYDSIEKKWMDHNKDRFISLCCAVDPEKAETPVWDAALSLVMPGDAMRDYWYRFCGYAMTGHTNEQCFAFLHGPGQSGKSSLLEVLQEVMGTYATTASIGLLTKSRSERHPEELAAFRGVRFVVSDELDEDRHWDEAKLKHMISGEAIRARFMRANSFVFVPKFKIAISGNNKPMISDTGKAMRRRIHLLPFDQIPDDRKIDKIDLMRSLRKEYPGIVYKFLQGLDDWRRHALNPPRLVVEATDTYVREEDIVAQWLEDNNIIQCLKAVGGGSSGLIDQQQFSSTQALLKDFNSYCRTAGEPSRRQNWLTRQLRERWVKDGDKSARLRYGKDWVDRDGVKQPDEVDWQGKPKSNRANVNRLHGFYGLRPPIQEPFSGWPTS